MKAENRRRDKKALTDPAYTTGNMSEEIVSGLQSVGPSQTRINDMLTFLPGTKLTRKTSAIDILRKASSCEMGRSFSAAVKTAIRSREL